MEATIMAMTRTYTADEVFDLEDDERHELIDGELFTLPGSGGRASAIGLRIGRLIGNYLEDHPSGYVLGADGSFVVTHHPETMFSPDASYITFNRLPGGVLPEKFIPTWPDLAIEVLSPSDRRIEAERKVQRYLAAGTPLVWLIDPKSETVMVYRRSGSSQQLARGQTLSGEDVLPGFEVSVDRIFNLARQK
jgi:Uma2 family endonuclease